MIAGISKATMNWPLSLGRRDLLKILEMCNAFFLDVSVLIFVFPVLDMIVERGTQSVSRQLFWGSTATAGVFFGLALVTGVMLSRRQDR
jgi:hypothetical protein